jgi:hypothetical protein
MVEVPTDLLERIPPPVRPGNRRFGGSTPPLATPTDLHLPWSRPTSVDLSCAQRVPVVDRYSPGFGVRWGTLGVRHAGPKNRAACSQTIRRVRQRVSHMTARHLSVLVVAGPRHPWWRVCQPVTHLTGSFVSNPVDA